MNKILSLEISMAVLLSIATISLIYPYGFPLFSIVAILIFTVMLIDKKIHVRFNIGFILLYLMIILYFLGLFLTAYKLYPYNLSEIKNIIIIIMLLFILSNTNRNSLNQISSKFLTITTLIVPIFAVYSLYKYSLLLKGIELEAFKIDGRTYPWGTSLMPDYNMFALGMFIGLVATISKLNKSNKIGSQMLYLIATVIIMLAIIFSGSRRGWVVLILAISYFLYIILRKYIVGSMKAKITLGLTIVLFIILAIILISKNTIEITNQYEIDKLQYRLSTLEDSTGLSSRTIMWTYALDIIVDYNALNYLIGDGFTYIEQYGNYFNNISGYSHPHNTFLSTFFYSGIIGLVVFGTLIILPYILYIKNKRYIPIQLILIYVLCQLFLLISGNSFFAINIMWLLTTILVIGNKGADKIPNEKNCIHSFK